MDALELRADLLESQEDDFIREQVALLRKHGNGLPIIFTVRTKGQGGKFDGQEEEMFALLALGVRLCCEYIDMEACWTPQHVIRFLTHTKLGSSPFPCRIISSFHDFESKPTFEGVKALFDKCYSVGLVGEYEKTTTKRCLIDVVKVVVFAREIEDVFVLQQAKEAFASGRPNLPSSVHEKEREASSSSPSTSSSASILLPIIAIAAGERGKLSRVLNRYMTPVTHPFLATAAAPGNYHESVFLSLLLK